jgi:peptidoglycan hydrolase-like protein with peptidoglycan-binding domain
MGGAGSPRAFRPANPAMTGDDVRAVQRGLAAATIQAPQNGRYDGPTAVAVARFQKRNGLNVNGVVDAATRQKLALKPEADQKVNPVPRQPDQPVSPVPRPGRPN